MIGKTLHEALHDFQLSGVRLDFHSCFGTTLTSDQCRRFGKHFTPKIGHFQNQLSKSDFENFPSRGEVLSKQATPHDDSLNLGGNFQALVPFFPHRAFAALLAICFRWSGLIFFIRASALFFPPSLPRATAAAFFFLAIAQHSRECSSGPAIFL